ncbi:hypothetical protein DAMA08_023080 [Martiniozyma asiatica (nom. inval.)]|nr:hypothetical protein DAMA08_023080 [Martiniozyma asiatica]
MEISHSIAPLLSSDNAARAAAEKQLAQTTSRQLLPPLLELLAISNDDSISLLILSILKMRIKSYWFIRKDNEHAFDEKLENDVKESLVSFLVSIPDPFKSKVIINQILNIINLIVTYEHREPKENSLSTRLIQLASDTLKNSNGGTDTNDGVDAKTYFINMNVILTIIKPERYSLESKDLFNQIGTTFIPWYEKGLQCQFNTQNKNQFELVLYKLIKIFYNLTIISIPDSLLNVLSIWNENFISFLSYKNEKISKWCIKFNIKIFKKFRSSDKIPIEISQYISNQLAPNSLDLILKQLNNITLIDQPKVKYYLTLLLSDSSINNNSTYQILKLYLNEIITKLVIPDLSLIEEEYEEFFDDPISFMMRLENDNGNHIHMLISSLILKDESIILPIFELIINILQSGNYGSMVCAFQLLNTIIDKIDKNNLDNTIQLIMNINESLDSSSIWIRCYICEFLTRIDNVNLTINYNLQMPLPLLITTLKLNIFKNSNYNVFEVMTILIQLSTNYSLDIIYELIDLVVLNHPQEIKPFNLDLIDKLIENFISLCGEDFNENITQMSNILNNLLTIIISIGDKELILNLNDKIVKIIKIILENGILDILTETIEILETINSLTKKVLNLDIVLESFKNFGIEYPDIYQIYFETVLNYGSIDDINKINELMNWIFIEELEKNDIELNSIMLELISLMILNPNSQGINNIEEIYHKTLKTAYDFSVEQQDNFLEDKIVIKCILSGLVNKINVVLNIIPNLSDIVNALKTMIDESYWKTVFDLKLGILSLLQIVNLDICAQLRSSILQLILIMIDKLPLAIDHRAKLMKIESSKNVEIESEVEIEYDEEYDELNRETPLDNLNVLEIAKNVLNL